MRPYFQAAYLIFTLITTALATIDPDASVTIDLMSGYDYQRECGRACIQNNYNDGPDIEAALGCTWNACYCGAQYQSTISSHVSSCWTAMCGKSESALLKYDVPSALSLYSQYCGELVTPTEPTTNDDKPTATDGAATTAAGSADTTAVQVFTRTVVTVSTGSPFSTSQSTSLAWSEKLLAVVLSFMIVRGW
jgi:hypothetical protein